MSHWPDAGIPEDTAPQPKAHIGGNQVIGLSSSRTALGAGAFIAPHYWERLK
jgi:hypothetical protein